MKRSILLIIFSLIGSWILAQPSFELEDAFQKYIFSTKSVSGIRWMKDGSSYTALESNEDGEGAKIVQYDITSGESLATILNSNDLKTEAGDNLVFSGYSFSASEKQIILTTDEERIYRHSRRSIYYIYDRESKKLTLLANGSKIMYSTLSPDGKHVAYVHENNMFAYSLEDGKTTQITKDGRINEVLNGGGDWVYEEEFRVSKAFKWSPDSKMIAFFRFDETDVPEYNMQMWKELYPPDYRFKYPKAGEKNSLISAHIFNLENSELTTVDVGEESDIYLPRMNWLPDSKTLSLVRLNRLQNQLDILHHEIETGSTSVILTENSDTYVDINFNDDLLYLDNGKQFIKTSEKSGFKHLYLYDNSGKELWPITSGEYEVESFYGIDQANELLYFTSTEVSSIERHLYVVNLKGKGKKQLNSGSGVHRYNFSPGMKYYIDYHSSSEHPEVISLHKANGKKVKVLEDNEDAKQMCSDRGFVQKEFFEVKAENGNILNAYMLKPESIKAGEKLPVLMFVYGGPGSQTVMDNWGGMNDWWHQYLVQKGYLVVSVDNRGTGGKGVEFKHNTYGQMGKLEHLDQIAAAKYLQSLDYVDPERIGIWGWSYGGYMSSLSLFLGADVFKMAISVAPVTNWRYYDTIYTERYQSTPQLNPGGYDDYSPLSHAEKLKGNFLLIHGTGDDNVHVQHSIYLQDKLIRSNKQFTSFYYPNKNHGIYGGNTRLHLYTMMTNFVLNNL